MTRTKKLPGTCTQCGGLFEFGAELIGTTAVCPRCGQPTELTLAIPPVEPEVPRRIIIWSVTAVIILVFGLGAALFALKRAQNWAEHRKPPTAPATNSVPKP